MCTSTVRAATNTWSPQTWSRSWALEYIFFFEQKTAYEMRTDWSSDVCSSDLTCLEHGITLVIEPLNTAETNVINKVDEGTAWAQRVQLPNVYGLADTYHMDKMGETVESLIRSEERRVGKECRGRWGPAHARRQ